LTWEFGGGTSWVNLRLAPDGQKARLTLEHIAHTDGIGEEHLKQYGPGATGGASTPSMRTRAIDA
jgi:hypothetical protein